MGNTVLQKRWEAVLLLEGFTKEEGKRWTKKISRCARNDSVGSGYTDDSVKNGYLRYRIKCSLRKHSFRIVIPSEVEGSFSLAIRR